ncbi:MAG: hypothetical protein EAX96_07585 [Candidatus Lokiarchaeota archaeon]|nr:hypothetical protein [Candidatus Lokiarchaeota archaeon]
MQEYFDLHIHSKKDFLEMIALLEKFKYSSIAVINIQRNELNQLNNSSLKIYSRINLKSNNINELKQLLSRNINKYDLISIRSEDKSTFNWAIQDSRIDLLTFKDESNYSIFTYEAAKLCAKNEKPIELIISPFLYYTGQRRSKFMRLLSKLIKILIKSKAPFIISSNAHSKWDLRAPKDMVRILNLVELPYENSIHGVTTYALNLIKNYEQKKEKFNNPDLLVIDEI